MASIIVTYLRRERRAWGLTQDELAALVGMKSRGQISVLEHGRAKPTAKQLVALQLLFGKTAAQLFPKLARDAEERVMRTVTELAHGQDARGNLRAQRKNTLFRQTLSRAVMS